MGRHVQTCANTFIFRDLLILSVFSKKTFLDSEDRLPEFAEDHVKNTRRIAKSETKKSVIHQLEIPSPSDMLATKMFR